MLYDAHSSGEPDHIGGAAMEGKVKIKASCWNCGKAVKVPADNNNIYTRICKPCNASIPNETPKFYFRATKSGRAVDL